MTNETRQIYNSRMSDSGAKLMFGNNTLCAQFLRDYSGIKELEGVTAEDIHDMTERYTPVITEERESDVVKKVCLPGDHEMFMVTLFEHKSSVDQNVSMQLLRYMVYIWENYEKEMEGMQRGISRTKGFRYPPILPIVYYEDTAEWTAPLRFQDRIFMGDVFEEYVPDFCYSLFPLQKVDRMELIRKGDEVSFLMLLCSMRSFEDFRQLVLPEGYLESISRSAPEDVLRTMERMISVFLRNLHVPEGEISEFTNQIKERKMGRLFEHFEFYDVQATRAESWAGGRAEGLAEGKVLQVIQMVCRKLKKNKPPEAIAEELDEDLAEVQRICEFAEGFAPEYDAQKIYDAMKSSQSAF